MKYDIGVLGWWYGVNYGSVLTYYGLNQALRKMGYNVLMVNETLGYNGWRVAWPEDIMSIKFAKRQGYNMTRQFYKNELNQLNDLADTFIVGSDQLWNPGIPRVNEDLLLNFVNDDNSRIAYGTSISRGEEYFNRQWIQDMKTNLSKFSGISVRENNAVDIIKRYTNMDATKVVDPVYLLDMEDYEELANQATETFTGSFMTLFLLDPSQAKKEVALNIARKLKFENIVVVPNPEADIKIYKELFNEDIFTILGEAKPENMLAAYSQAGYIVTDSFHGTVFATIFEKPFNSFYNMIRGAARFEELMDLVKLGDSRKVEEGMSQEAVDLSNNVSLDIDYTEGRINLEEKKEFSRNWLRNTINKKTPLSFQEEFEKFIEKNNFVFYRVDGDLAVISKNVTFDKYGVISGIPSANERYWRYSDEVFEILNSENKPTTIFPLKKEDIVFDENEFNLIGEFARNSNMAHALSTVEYYKKNIINPYIFDILKNNRLVFSRLGDENPIADNVVIDKDLSIIGIESPNEDSIRLIDDRIEILNSEGNPTTIFDISDIEEVDDENLKLIGYYVDNHDIKHVLELEK